MNFIKKNKVVILLFVIAITISTGLYILSIQPPTITSTKDFKAPTTQKVKVDNQVVNNFYKDPSYLYTQGDVVVDENVNYQIAYIATQDKFIISIYNTNTTSRTQAEAAFLIKLGVDKPSACKFNTLVQVYLDDNASQLPEVSKLSFCN